MRAISLGFKNQGKKVGFVPTMGALHEGQLSLVDIARENSDFVVASIFVNPLQFGPQEDFKNYPRDLERDAQLLGSRDVDILFAPEAEKMYPRDYETYIEVPQLSKHLCGCSRYGFFKGICTVVFKLFNIVVPDIAVFGEKDAQQVIIIKKMVQDLNVEIQILTGPTIREPDGLAMSSRNIYLTKEERKDAAVLYKSLLSTQTLIKQGERNIPLIKEGMQRLITQKPAARIDYINIVRYDNLEPLKELVGKFLIALAVWFGKARLIDNITIDLGS